MLRKPLAILILKPLEKFILELEVPREGQLTWKTGGLFIEKQMKQFIIILSEKARLSRR